MSQIRSNILIISKDNTNLSSALRAINSDGTIILDVNNDGTTQFGTGFKISSGGNSASVTGLFPIFDGFGGSFEAALIGLTGDISIGGSLMLNNSGFSKIYGGTNYGIIYSSVAGDQLHDFRGNVKILGSDSSSLNYALKIDNSSNISLLKISNDGRSIFNYGLSVLGTNFGHTFSGISGYSNIFTIGEEGLSNTYFKIDTGGSFQFGNIASTKIFSFDNSNFSFMTANVGIGTETPSAKLEVYGSANNYARLGSQYSTIRESASAFLQFSFNYNEDFYLYAKGIFLSNPTTNKSINNTNSGDIGVSYNYNFSDYSFKSYDSLGVNYFEINHIGYYGQNRLGVNVTPTATIHAKGFDSTSGSYGLKVDNSSSVPLFYIRNDGLISITNSNFATFGIKNIFETDAYNTYLQIEPVVASSNKFYVSTIGYGFWNYGSANPNVSPLDGSGLLYKNTGFEVVTYGSSSKFVRFNVTNPSSYIQYYAGYSDASFNFQSDIFRVGKGGTYNFLQIDATNAGAGITKMGLGGLGALSNITALLHLKSDDSLSTNFALKVDNSSNTPLLYVSNNGTVTIKAFGGFSADVTLGVAGFTHTYGWKSKGHNRIEYGANDFSTDTRPMIEWNNSIASAVFLTGIKDDDSWGIYTAFDWKFIINKNTGNVGLGGATSPDASLHVRGISSTSADFALKVENSASSPLLYVRNDGNVGIGTSTLPYKLNVEGQQVAFNFTLDGSGSGTPNMMYSSTTGGLLTTYTVQTGGSVYNTYYTNGVPTNKINLQNGYMSLQSTGRFDVTKLTDGKLKLSVDMSTGFTAIGQDYFVPSAQLHVRGVDSTSSNFALKVDNSSNTPLLYVRNDGSVGVGGTSIYSNYKLQIIISSANDGLQIIGGGVGSALLTTDSDGSSGTLKLYNSALGSNAVVFNNNSNSYIITPYNFGVGISSPTAKLHIQGSDSLSTNYALKVDNSSSTSLLYVRNDGNVGIGMIPTTNKLSVFGSNGTTSQLFINGGINNGAISFLAYSQGNNQILFDANFEGSSAIAKSSMPSAIVSFGDQLRIGGNVGATIGAAVSINTLLNINFTNGNVGIGIGIASANSKLQVLGLIEYINNAAAQTAGLSAGAFYRTGEFLKVVF